MSAPSPVVRTRKVKGDLIRQLRLKRAWRLEDLARDAGCSSNTIRNLERNCEALLVTIADVAKALGVEPDELIAGNPDPPPPTSQDALMLTIRLSVDRRELDQCTTLIEFARALVKTFSAEVFEIRAIRDGSTLIDVTMDRSAGGLLYKSAKRWQPILQSDPLFLMIEAVIIDAEEVGPGVDDAIRP